MPLNLTMIIQQHNQTFELSCEVIITQKEKNGNSIKITVLLWKRTPILIEFQGGVQLRLGWGSLAQGGAQVM